MIRYWFFAALRRSRSPRRRRAASAGSPRTSRLGLQIVRGVLLVVEICVTVLSFVLLGLIGTHAIFAVYPLLVAALAGPVLGEYVGWRRGLAIGVGLARRAGDPAARASRCSARWRWCPSPARSSSRSTRS